MPKRSAKVSIILLNWNGYLDTLECLRSLEKITYPNVQVIVVDNGSTDQSVSKMRKIFPEIPILETGENLGFAGGNNFGIDWSYRHLADWVLLLNNDTVVAPDFLNALMEAANLKPQGGIFGAKLLNYSQPDLIDHLGGFWDPKTAEFFSHHKGKRDHLFFEMQLCDYVCGASFLIKKKVIETIGLLEPKFFLFWEETDYCYRAKKAGFETWSVPKAKVWHKISASFTGGKPQMHYFWWRSRLLWIQRNCSTTEKKALYRKILFPQMFKMVRHLFFKLAMNWVFPSLKRREKIQRYKAGCAGIFDYFRKKFGSCPNWLLKKN